MNEWMTIIKSLPKNKAAGPFGIYNEYLQYLNENAYKLLLHLIRLIIKVGDIPAE